MAFTFRPNKETEKILLDYMKKEDIKDKSKCLNFLINSRPALDKELAEKRKVTDKILAPITKENDRLKGELEKISASVLLISEETFNYFESLIRDLSGKQKDIQNWKKKNK
jgi:hypothetical protein